MIFIKFVTFLLILKLDLISSQCNVSPQYWCDSKEIAEQCGVIHACYNHWQTFQKAEPVSVELYYESLCPDCREFISDQFYPSWVLLQDSGILSVDLIAYGNAHESQLSSGQWNYTCQHGPKECEGNLIENCIMDATNYNTDMYMPIIFCIENSSDPLAAAEKCVVSGNLNWKHIESCSKGDQGNALMHKAAVKTDALKPPHKYVPWIVANGVHTEELQDAAQKDFFKFVCDMYKGTKPKECQPLIKGCVKS